MSSKNAENVAKEVLKKVGKGKLMQFKQILRENGYSESVARSPTKVTKTKSYQKVMQPVLKQMKRARDKALEEINNKDLTKVQYHDLITGANKLTHDIQLLSGGDTERDTKPTVVVYGSNDLLAKQLKEINVENKK